MKRLVFLGSGLIIGVAFVAAWGMASVRSAKSDEGHHVDGIVTTFLSSVTEVGSLCQADNSVNVYGLSLDLTDLVAVPQVVVRDQDGKIVAKVDLQHAPVAHRSADDPWGDQQGTECDWSFTIDGLPDRPFYSVQVGLRASRVFTNAEFFNNGQGPRFQIIE
jgi:hypothetical protein